MTSVICEKKIHLGWQQMDDAHQRGQVLNIQSPIGKYQWIFSSEKGKISLVELPNYFRDGKTLWEIYSLEGNLFEDIDRFDSFEEAEKKCKELLTVHD